LLVLTNASFAFGADIEGEVLDVRCKPVAQVHLLVENSTGKILGSAPTDKLGNYQITGLVAGTYDYVLDSTGTGFKSGTTTSYLNDNGARMDWKVSPTSPAVALSSEKTGKRLITCTPFALSPGEIGAAAVGASALVAGGVIGGYGGAGGFSGSSGSSPSHLSQPPGSASQ
jgi:hypothetical protein